jgi:hypothetical protein
MFSQLDAIVLSTQAYLTEAHVLLCPFLLLFTLSCRHVQARQEVREQYYSFTICTVCCVSSVYRCVARAGAASSACLTLRVSVVTMSVFDVFVHMAPAVAVLGVLNQLTDTC